MDPSKRNKILPPAVVLAGGAALMVIASNDSVMATVTTAIAIALVAWSLAMRRDENEPTHVPAIVLGVIAIFAATLLIESRLTSVEQTAAARPAVTDAQKAPQ